MRGPTSLSAPVEWRGTLPTAARSSLFPMVFTPATLCFVLRRTVCSRSWTTPPSSLSKSTSRPSPQIRMERSGAGAGAGDSGATRAGQAMDPAPRRTLGSGHQKPVDWHFDQDNQRTTGHGSVCRLIPRWMSLVIGNRCSRTWNSVAREAGILLLLPLCGLDGTLCSDGLGCARCG
jgi:hypothetical protein